jgi:hypothetical protein
MGGVLSAVGRRLVHARGGRVARRFDRLISHCEQTQQRTLQRLLGLNGGTRFQRDHGLAAHLSVADFRRRISITTFDDVAPYVEDLRCGRVDALCGPRNKPLMLALSSGTTGEAKHIPITTRFLADYRRSWMVWAWHAFEDHPRAPARKILQLSSDHKRFIAPGGLPCGNISGLVQAMQNRLVRSKYVLPAAVNQITDAAAKRYVALRLALTDPDVSLIVTANPSTLVQLARQADDLKDSLLRDIHDGTLSADCPLPAPLRTALHPLLARKDPVRARELLRLAQRNDRLRPCDYWPHAALIAVWTGGSCSAYLPTLRDWFGEVPIRDHGLSASEGRMTIPIQDNTSTGVLDVTSHFFEFIPAEQGDEPDPETLLAHQLEEGADYCILLTTASGLYRYNICDVVRCRGFAGTTPLLEFLHKGAHIASLTGEKLTESQVVAAVAAACETAGCRLGHYTLCPVWGEPPGYRLLVEATDLPNERLAARFAADVEDHLQQLNCEYREKRGTDRLKPVTVHPLPPGTWQRWITRHHTRPGSSPEQYKHPCLKPELEFFEQITRLAAPAALMVDG